MSDYYIEKLNEIKSLKENKPLKALEIVKEELKMPYIPLKYEGEFNSLYIELLNSIEANNNPRKYDTYDLITLLNSNVDKKQLIALSELKSANVRKIKYELKEFIETQPKPSLKNFVYEILSDQEIDINLKINNKIINPLKNGSILKQKDYQVVLSKINDLVDKDPNLLEMINAQFYKYILDIFPSNIDNPIEFANDFTIAIKSMFDSNIKLTNKQTLILNSLS